MSVIVHHDLGVSVDAKVTLQIHGQSCRVRYKAETVVSDYATMRRASILGEDWHELRGAFRLNPAPALRLTLSDGTTLDLAHAQSVISGSGKVVFAGALQRGSEVMGRVRSAPVQTAEDLLARPLHGDEFVYCKDGNIANCDPFNLEIVTEATAKTGRRGKWRLAPRFEVRPVKIASIRKLDKKAELCRLVCQPYFANGVLLASA